MSNELKYTNPAYTSETLYAVRFNDSMQPFLTNGASAENWSAADTYDVALAEVGSGGGSFLGDFDVSANISEGIYPVNIYHRVGGSPTNGDPKIGEGEINWDGTAERSIADAVLDEAVVRGLHFGRNPN